jgi:hypothetical protein
MICKIISYLLLLTTVSVAFGGEEREPAKNQKVVAYFVGDLSKTSVSSQLWVYFPWSKKSQKLADIPDGTPQGEWYNFTVALDSSCKIQATALGNL